MQDVNKVLHYVSIMDRAGEETFIMNVFRSIDRNQVMFDFLVTENREGDYDKEIRSLGGNVRHFSKIMRGGPIKRFLNFFKLKRYLSPLSKEYTTFHIHTQHAMDAMLDALSAELAGFKTVVVHSHSTSTLYHLRAHFLCRPILNKMPIVRLACSDAAGKWLYGDDGNYEIVSNGIITDNFLYDDNSRKTIREEEHWNDRIVIGHVGNFTYPKNHSFILDVFIVFLKKHPDAVLALAGKGTLMEEAIQKAKNLGISDNVRFLGSRGDANKLFSAFDVLLFPSHYEGLPVTLVEAQAADLPCLISDAITTETDISPKLRRMSLNNTAEEWAKALDEMIGDDNRRNVKDCIISSGYDIGVTVKRLTEIYRGNR
ncbi:glycosyltransferase family 1 protein [Butyrivibrio proteoclasticus]|nr:glycosyltransferase family 1 protein [Butyrivibrio proteoclasticus]